MGDSVLISRNITRSTIAVGLGQRYPDRADKALWIWLALLSDDNRDDWGRGKYIPFNFLNWAFAYSPTVMLGVQISEVEEWIRFFAEEGSVVLYGADERGRSPAYYFLPKFKLYNPLKYRKASKMPPPPGWDEDTETIEALKPTMDPIDVERAQEILDIIRRNYALWDWKIDKLPRTPTAKDVEAMRLLREKDHIKDADYRNFRRALKTDVQPRGNFCWAQVIRSPAAVRKVCNNGESKFWNMVNFARAEYSDAERT